MFGTALAQCIQMCGFHGQTLAECIKMMLSM